MNTRTAFAIATLGWIFSTTTAHADAEHAPAATTPAPATAAPVAPAPPIKTPATERATANFLEHKHRWSATAKLAQAHSDLKHPEESMMRADLLVLARPPKAGQLTIARFDHQAINLWLSNPQLAHNRIFRQRFATVFALANPGMHTGKLSELAVDPYAVLCMNENAGAILDVDYAHLLKTPHAHRESLLVAAANAPNHRAALTEMLDHIVKDSAVPPDAKVDMRARAVSVTTALIEWISVLPDADLDLIKTKLMPQVAALGVTAQFGKELDEILPLLVPAK